MEYENYTNSNLDYVGEIPDAWKLKKIKRLVKICNGKDHKKVSTPKGEYPILGTGGVFTYSNEYLYDKPSVLLGRKGTIDNPIYVEEPFWTVDTLFYTKIEENVFPKFFFYSTKIIPFLKFSTSTAVPSMTQDTLNFIELPIPSFDEQKEIANYLDVKTAEIDKLELKTKNQIERLKEIRASIISEICLNGFNKDTKKKKTRCEWIVEIPEHWEMRRLKYCSTLQFSNVDKKTHDSEIPVILCNYVDVYKNDFIKKDLNFMKASAKESEISKFKLEKGDVLVTKDSESPDDIAQAAVVRYTQDNLICGYHLAQIKPDKTQLLGEYLFRLFGTKKFNDQFMIAANGVTRFGLGIYPFNNAMIPLPPIDEQKEIAEYLDDKTEKIDKLIKNKEDLLLKLEEYKKILIHNVVTGKVKVVE